MPQERLYSNIYCKRFDFGVPLEDIFPPNNIHPRLKYLFEKAFEVYKTNDVGIDEVLSNCRGSLKECMDLKEKLITATYYDIECDGYSPRAYFWLLKHFLSLLPLPLFPDYTRGLTYDWSSLAIKCKYLFCYYERQRKNKSEVDYLISQIITTLPFENILLLNMMVAFVRKLSVKHCSKSKIINRMSIMRLTKYFCGAIFSRPFYLGNSCEHEEMLPLLFYIFIRWSEIQKCCQRFGSRFCYSECGFYISEYNGKTFKDNACQASQCSPDVITLCRPISYFPTDNVYLKDNGCQTDLCESLAEQTDKSTNVTNYDMIVENSARNQTEWKQKQNKLLNDMYRIAYLGQDQVEEGDYSKANDNNASPFENNLEEIKDFSFLSKDDSKNQKWSDVLNETYETVKKIEEYIYDDYETFQMEDFNQITNKKPKPSVLERIYKMGWTYTSPNSKIVNNKDDSNAREEVRDTSYIKYPDVFEETLSVNSYEQIETNDLNESTIVNLQQMESTRIEEKSSSTSTPKVGQETDMTSDKSRHKHAESIIKKGCSVKNTKGLELFIPGNTSCSSVPAQIHSQNQLLKRVDKEKNSECGSSVRKRSFQNIRTGLTFLKSLTKRNSELLKVESNVRYQRMNDKKPHTY